MLGNDFVGQMQKLGYKNVGDKKFLETDLPNVRAIPETRSAWASPPDPIGQGLGEFFSIKNKNNQYASTKPLLEIHNKTALSDIDA